MYLIISQNEVILRNYMNFMFVSSNKKVYKTMVSLKISSKLSMMKCHKNEFVTKRKVIGCLEPLYKFSKP